MTRAEIWYSIIISIMLSSAVAQLSVWAYSGWYIEGVHEGTGMYGEWYMQALEEQKLRGTK